MEENVEIQFKDKYLSNKIGNSLIFVLISLVFIYIYSAWFENLSFEENAIFIITLLFGFTIAGSLSLYRTYEKATLSFIPEGIIIKSKIGYIPIKFKDITYFKSMGIVSKTDNKIEFTIETINSKKYKIKSEPTIYEGLIKVFPNKNGKYLE